MKQREQIDRNMANVEFAADEHNIDVWLAFYDSIDEASLAGFQELLSPDEQEKQIRFLFEDDRKRYLVTRGMVRTVLSLYASVSPGDWTFLANRFGRPQIADRHGEACHLSFNISHTRGLIALGVTRRRAIGVDVEHLAVRQAPVEIADRYFAPAEVCDLVHAPLCQQQHRFFEYWTLKESYIKARGMGLSIPLDKFSFHCLDERAVRLTTDPTVDDNANRWRFWQCRPTHDHLLAICADVGERAAPQVTIRKLVPPVAHTVLDLEFLKTSE